MATYVRTTATLGNLITSATVAVSASTVPATLDLSADISATLRIDVTYGAVVAGTYTVVSWYAMVDNTTAPTVNTLPDGQFQITPVAGQMVTKTFSLPGGEKWYIQVTNGDGTNAITVRASNDLVTGIA